MNYVFNLASDKFAIRYVIYFGVFTSVFDISLDQLDSNDFFTFLRRKSTPIINYRLDFGYGSTYAKYLQELMSTLSFQIRKINLKAWFLYLHSPVRRPNDIVSRQLRYLYENR